MAKHTGAFQRWRAWAQQCKEVREFPVSEVHFALYLQLLSESTHTRSAVQEAVNTNGWVNQVSGWEPIVQSTFVWATVAGLKWSLAKPKEKKKPVPLDMLSVLTWGCDNHSVS